MLNFILQNLKKYPTFKYYFLTLVLGIILLIVGLFYKPVQVLAFAGYPLVIGSWGLFFQSYIPIVDRYRDK